MSSAKLGAIVVACVAVYTAGWLLTAAYFDQHIYRPCYAAERAKQAADPNAVTLFSDCGVPPIVGMVWPLYWAWRGALHVTR
jgi:hypothetical protein